MTAFGFLGLCLGLFLAAILGECHNQSRDKAGAVFVLILGSALAFVIGITEWLWSAMP